jgi:hypothetical protein
MDTGEEEIKTSACGIKVYFDNCKYDATIMPFAIFGVFHVLYLSLFYFCPSIYVFIYNSGFQIG